MFRINEFGSVGNRMKYYYAGKRQARSQVIFVSPVCVFLYGPHNFDTRAKRAFPVWQNNVGLTPLL